MSIKNQKKNDSHISEDSNIKKNNNIRKTSEISEESYLKKDRKKGDIQEINDMNDNNRKKSEIQEVNDMNDNKNDSEIPEESIINRNKNESKVMQSNIDRNNTGNKTNKYKNYSESIKADSIMNSKFNNYDINEINENMGLIQEYNNNEKDSRFGNNNYGSGEILEEISEEPNVQKNSKNSKIKKDTRSSENKSNVKSDNTSEIEELLGKS